MAQATAGKLKHGTLVFAHDQWAGKGQRGRTWNSNPGENIILSVVLEPVAMPISATFGLSACVAMACHDLFSNYAGLGPTRIKWPNDLYWNDRKAGGILIENHFKGDRWLFAIAGMGVNINQVAFPATARLPVSLRQITGRPYDAMELARELGNCLERRFAALENGGVQAMVDAYNGVLYRKGEEVRLKKDNAVFTTRVERVSVQGELLTRDVLDRCFTFGEVEWVM